MRWTCVVLAWLLAIGLPLGTRAQGGQLLVPARPLSSLSPADTSFADLEFLRTELGGARVVFLGEPTHGEGNVLAAKARLVAFLQQRLGFTTLALESGFFGLHKAQQSIAAGKSVIKNLQASIFPIWMQTQEFQAVLPLVGPAGGLRVMGFDPQLSGDYSDDVTDDLEDFLEGEKGAAALDYKLLDEVAASLAARQALPPAHPLLAYEAELAKAEPLLRRAASAPQATRRAEAAFWQQCLRSLAALARASVAPGAGTAADNNIRDAQMADNLLWYLRQHPAEKVVCWGALPHFANRVELLNSAELRDFRPMGRLVKTALGAGQVYVLGTLAGGGTYGPAGQPGTPVPAPAPGTLETSLLGQAAPYAFVSLKHDAPGRQLTTYALDYQPLAGPWSEVVDGLLFFKAVEPPHRLPADSTDTPPDSAARVLTAAGAALGSRNPAPGLGGPTLRQTVGPADVSGVRLVRGQVLDQHRRTPVPYATLLLPALGRTAAADAEGRFALEVPGPTALVVNRVGYAASTARTPVGNEELTVLLPPAAYALDELRQASPPPSPLEIVRRVVQRLPANHPLLPTQAYVHRRLSSFDTLRYEDEAVGRWLPPAGRRANAPSQWQPTQRRLVQQQGPAWAAPLLPPPGFDCGADPLRTAPLFVGKAARRYVLALDSVHYTGPDTLYVLTFATRPADRRATGTAEVAAYQGRLLVRRRDYAVLRYEALWLADTAACNAAARQQARRTRQPPPHLEAGRRSQVVAYERAVAGHYYARQATCQALGRGSVGRRAFYAQTFEEQYAQPLPAAALAEPVAAPGPPAVVPYRPEFWESYRRPAGVLLPATPAP